MINLLTVVGALVIINKKGGLPWMCHKIEREFRSEQDERNRAHQKAGRKQSVHPKLRLSVFEQLPIGPNDTVLLGDSLLSDGEWHEFFNESHVKNRAIGGDTTHTLLNRLSRIIAGKPRHVVILCGINNVYSHMPYEQTTEEYARIVATISSQSQDSDIWLLSILPVNKTLHKKWIVPAHPGVTMPDQTEVEAVNAFIKSLAGDRQSRIHFVDLSAFLDSTGGLSEDFTDDGLHLNGRGMKELATHLQKLGL